MNNNSDTPLPRPLRVLSPGSGAWRSDGGFSITRGVRGRFEFRIRSVDSRAAWLATRGIGLGLYGGEPRGPFEGADLLELRRLRNVSCGERCTRLLFPEPLFKKRSPPRIEAEGGAASNLDSAVRVRVMTVPARRRGVESFRAALCLGDLERPRCYFLDQERVAIGESLGRPCAWKIRSRPRDGEARRFLFSLNGPRQSSRATSARAIWN